MLLIATERLHQIIEFALVIHVKGIFKDVFEDVDCAVDNFLRSTQATLGSYYRPIPICDLSPDILQLSRLANHLECDVLGKCNRFFHSICFKESIDKVDPVLHKNL